MNSRDIVIVAIGLFVISLPPDMLASNQSGFRYSAYWIATDSEGESRSATLSFTESNIYDTEADYVVGFEGCKVGENKLALSSEITWLNFEIDLSDKSGKRDQRAETASEVLFQGRTIMMGLDVRVIAVHITETRFTIIYFNDIVGIIGIGLFDGKPINYVQPIYWLEGKSGLCHK